MPRGSRPRAKPGRGRKSARAAARSAKPGHSPKGAHPAPPRPRRATLAVRKPRRAVSRHPAGAPAAVRRPARRLTAKPAPRRTRFTPRPAQGAGADPARVSALVGILERLYPQATTALRHENPLQLLVATILSAQCTDERVNMVTPALFAKHPDAASLAAVPQADLEAVIRSTGFFRNKARAIRECCADVVAKHGGQVPRTMEELTALRGVGRKTANVVLGNAYGVPGLVVDTHVARLSQRLGLTGERDPVRIEQALMPVVAREKWTRFSHWLILHGRQVCIARKPRCSICPLLPHCPRAGVAASQ